MNQSILFPDLQDWDDQQACVAFPAQSQGMNIECFVTQAYLSRLSETKIDSPEQALTIFDEWRFDIEEAAEILINKEAFDSNGRVFLR